MGEKVYVRRATDHDASDPPVAEAVPLDYGNPHHLNWLTLLRRRVVPIVDVLDDCLRRGVERVGGVRQITFACGLSLIFGGIGAALSRWTDVTFFTGLGGLLVGLAIRVPSLKR